MHRGKVTYKTKRESSYEGSFDYQGKRHGYGVMCFEDGSFYEGNWEDDQMNGRGRMVWSNGSSYFGEWFFGIRHGQGTQTDADGSVFQGFWRNGQPPAQTHANTAAAAPVDRASVARHVISDDTSE